MNYSECKISELKEWIAKIDEFQVSGKIGLV